MSFIECRISISSLRVGGCWATPVATLEKEVVVVVVAAAAAAGGGTSSLKLFAPLLPHVLQDVLGKLKVHHYGKGEDIFLQGSNPDGLYIVDKGRCEVIQTAYGHTKTLSVLESGNYFGEQALLNGSKRKASVRALDEGTICHVLLAPDFHRLLKPLQGLIKRQSVTRLLQGCFIFEQLSDGELQTIADHTTTMEFEAGQYILREGQEGMSFFIIQSGFAKVSTTKGGKEELATLFPNDWFGEGALLFESRQRTADVVALSDLKLLSLGRQHFMHLMSASVLSRLRAVYAARQTQGSAARKASATVMGRRLLMTGRVQE